MEMAELDQQKILITGGTGFVGRYAIRRLIEEGHCVYAIVRNKEKLVNAIGETLSKQNFLNAIELRQPEKAPVTDLKSIIETNEITTIVHIAGVTGEHKISWTKYFEVNVLWTKNLASAFMRANVTHNKFVFTSSVGVYGTIPGKVPADERTPYNPDGKYHKSKVLAEKELLELQASTSLPLVILRPTILYGNEDRGFLYKFFTLMSKKMFPFCKSDPCIHLLDVELLADIYSELVKWNERSSCVVFNVGDNHPIKISKLSEYVHGLVDGGYLAVPSVVFSFLDKLVAFNRQYSISLKLISKNWFYNVDRLYKTFNLKSMDTIQALDTKYVNWYKGAGQAG
jgi:nucleoside-diphosphate-sugar epimerase